MKTTTEKLPNRQIKLQVELEPEEVQKSLDTTRVSLMQRVSVPGFRKGKAPVALMERYVGMEAVFSEALKKIVPDAYERAIKEQSLEPVAQPEVEVLSREPLTFSAVVSLAPEVELGEYPHMKRDTAVPEIAPEQVDREVLRLQEKQATWLAVERAADFGDLLLIDASGEVDGKPFFNYKDATFRMIKGHPIPLPGFAEKLVGVTKGEKREFTIPFPADYSDVAFAGKSYSFKVEVKEVREAKLPELNDEFARSAGSDTVAALRDKIAADLKAQAEAEARAKWENDVFEALENASKAEFPPVVVERDINGLLLRQASQFRDGVKGLESYLGSLGKTLAQHREELRPSATKFVVHNLVVDKLAEKESITVSDAEVDDEIGKMDKDKPEGQKLTSSEPLRNLIKQRLLQRKALDRLFKIAEEGGE
ncbi:MAG: trigger factor [Chloroflexota bacterium]